MPGITDYIMFRSHLMLWHLKSLRFGAANHRIIDTGEEKWINCQSRKKKKHELNSNRCWHEELKRRKERDKEWQRQTQAPTTAAKLQHIIHHNEEERRVRDSWIRGRREKKIENSQRQDMVGRTYQGRLEISLFFSSKESGRFSE